MLFSTLVSRSICRPSDVRSISFDLYAWKLPNLVWWMPLREKLFPIDFQVTWSGVKIKLLVFVQMSAHYLLTPLLLKSSNLVPWMPIASKWLLLMFRSHDQRWRSNCWSLYKYCPLSIIWPLWLRVARLVAMDVPREKNFIIDFRSHGQRSKSNWWSAYKMLCAKSLLTPLLESCWTWFSRCLWRVHDPYWCSGYMFKVKLLCLVQILSSRCLLSPLVESCQTWFSGCL